MCENVYAFFRCAWRHAARGEAVDRLKHVVRCSEARAHGGVMCADRENVHILQEDDPDNDCPECKGETPPETPEYVPVESEAAAARPDEF